MTLVIKSGVSSGNTALPVLRRDPVLDGDNGGVKFLWDTAFDWCVPASAPTNGQTVKDISDHTDGSFLLASGQTVTYAGGGYDLSGLTADPAAVVGGAGCLSSIHAGNQYFLVMFWAKLPSSADWNKSATLAPMFTATDTQAGYGGGAELVTLAQVNAPTLQARRQTNGGTTYDSRTVSPAIHYGLVSQVAYWRNASGQGLQIRSSAGTTTDTGAVGVANTGNFSAKLPRWGVPEAYNSIATDANHANAHNTRIYRGMVEDLEVSGRNPVDVLAADYAFVTGLNRYS